jgi:hypothetical protein
MMLRAASRRQTELGQARVFAVTCGVSGSGNQRAPSGTVREMETLERLHARQERLVVEDDESPDGEWQVSWKVEEHLVD